MSHRPRPFVPEDLLGFRLISDIQLAGDGLGVMYELRTIDADNDRYAAQLWLTSTEGGEPRPFTASGNLDQSPRWSPDGNRLVFVSSRGGTPQLYVIARDGGEARALTSLEGGAQKALWSPDGATLLFVARVAVVQRPEGMDEQRWQQRPRVVTQAFYKSDGMGFTLDARAQVFTVPADGGGEARQLTSGMANHFTPAWSPDGRAIVFVRSRTGPRDAHRTDLWRMNADGSEPRQLTDDFAVVSAPAWSPDGKTITFQGSVREGDARLGLWLIDAEGGTPRRLGGDDFELASYPLDNASPPFWTADSAALLVLQAYRSTSRVVRVAVDGAITPLVDDDRQVTMLSVAPQAGRLIFSSSDASRFCEMWSTKLDGSESRMLANPNSEWAGGRAPFCVHQRSFRGASGEARDGWLLLPEGDAAGPRPLWLDIHGGPHTFVSLGYPYHPYWHVLLSHGWAVLALNTVGSSSYGARFAEQLRGTWGEKDLPEHLAAIDELVAEGLVDPKRVVIGGKSYGGYLSAWALGQTQRFCAAVVSAPVADMVSHFGTSDSGYYVTPYAMGGEVDQARETYDRLSPVRWLERASTPTLLLQGEDDQRCPVGQSEEIFATLMRLGRAPVEFVRYPGGDHHLAEQGTPSHRVDYNRRIVSWAQRWAERGS